VNTAVVTLWDRAQPPSISESNLMNTPLLKTLLACLAYSCLAGYSASLFSQTSFGEYENEVPPAIMPDGNDPRSSYGFDLPTERMAKVIKKTIFVPPWRSIEEHRAVLLERFGARHPHVRALDKLIAVRKTISDQKETLRISEKLDLIKMTDSELRAEILRFRKRIDKLKARNELLENGLSQPPLPSK